MFLVRGAFEAHGASIRSHSALAPQVYIGAVQHSGTLYDSQFAPPFQRSVNRAMIKLVVQGVIEWRGPYSATHQAPAAFRLGSAVYDGSGAGPRQTFRNSGECFSTIEVRLVTPADGRGVEVWECSEAVWTAARQYLASAWQGDRNSAGPLAVALIRALEGDGAIAGNLSASMTDEVEEPLGNLLDVMGRHYQEFEFLPSLQAIASTLGVSLRSLTRLLKALWSTFPALPWNFRDLALGVRIRFAVHLLSIETLPVHEVAQAAGYRHPSAMANAFQNAGIPSPREVRATLVRVRRASDGVSEGLPE